MSKRAADRFPHAEAMAEALSPWIVHNLPPSTDKPSMTSARTMLASSAPGSKPPEDA